MATQNVKRNRTTAADIAAAVALGAMAGDTVIMTNDPAVPEYGEDAPTVITLSATDHECGIAGCRHGNAHTAATQPDRQVKLACPVCGAIARMTATALARAGRIQDNCQADYAVATRRTYTRKAV